MIDLAHSFSPIESDVPEDMTLDMWRRRNVVAAKAAHAGRIGRIRRRAVELVFPPPPRIRVAYA